MELLMKSKYEYDHKHKLKNLQFLSLKEIANTNDGLPFYGSET